MLEETTLISLLLILFLGLLVPALTKHLRLPFVTSLILIGAILGPFGVDYIETNEIITFFGFLGFTFLMFMAGLEMKTSDIKEDILSLSILSLLNSLIPFIFGIFIGLYFGFDLITSLLLGVIFIASSIAIAVPVIKSTGLNKKKEGKIMIGSILITDSLSLLLLTIIFQIVEPTALLPLPIHFILLLVFIGFLKFFLPKIEKYFLKKSWNKKETHERQLRVVLVTLFLVLTLFSFLGVHPMLAAFITGLILSEIISSEQIFEKIHTLGYGLFIPVFFFVIGMQMDLTALIRLDYANLILLVIVFGLFFSKIISGFIAARIIGFTNRYSSIYGLLSSTKLTTSLAAAYTAVSLGLLDNVIITAIITLSIITTIFVPIIINTLIKK